MTVMGQHERFTSPRLNARCRLRKRSFAVDDYDRDFRGRYSPKNHLRRRSGLLATSVALRWACRASPSSGSLAPKSRAAVVRRRTAPPLGGARARNRDDGACRPLAGRADAGAGRNAAAFVGLGPASAARAVVDARRGVGPRPYAKAPGRPRFVCSSARPPITN
jgi:hypothetical protein